ncbi:hypothetical protein BJX64DRAFT_297298 [Aspergillus heterothallicus]
MAHINELTKDGPYGGPGGSAYDARSNESRVHRVRTWSADYAGYNVLGGIQFDFDDGSSSGRIGGRDPNINYYEDKPFIFDDGEKIEDMTVFAGDGEGFCNGIMFHTNKAEKGPWKGGSQIGYPFHVPDLGNGEWAGATGRDSQHGANAVVDNMVLYFRK